MSWTEREKKRTIKRYLRSQAESEEGGRAHTECREYKLGNFLSALDVKCFPVLIRRLQLQPFEWRSRRFSQGDNEERGRLLSERRRLRVLFCFVFFSKNRSSERSHSRHIPLISMLQQHC